MTLRSNQPFLTFVVSMLALSGPPFADTGTLLEAGMWFALRSLGHPVPPEGPEVPS
jgi:hypothetical protein